MQSLDTDGANPFDSSARLHKAVMKIPLLAWPDKRMQSHHTRHSIQMDDVAIARLASDDGMDGMQLIQASVRLVLARIASNGAIAAMRFASIALP